MTANPCWIETTDYERAGPILKAAFDKCRSPNGQIDNLYKAYSLMPHALGPADELYKAVLHHEANLLPKWLAELISTYVAILDGCAYAQIHHGKNFVELYEEHEAAQNIVQDLGRCGTSELLDPKTTSILDFVRELHKTSQNVNENTLASLRTQGLSDAEILEIVQIVACFAYFTRVINGLGIQINGEKTGHYANSSTA